MLCTSPDMMMNIWGQILLNSCFFCSLLLDNISLISLKRGWVRNTVTESWPQVATILQSLYWGLRGVWAYKSLDFSGIKISIDGLNKGRKWSRSAVCGHHWGLRHFNVSTSLVLTPIKTKSEQVSQDIIKEKEIWVNNLIEREELW